MSGLSLFEVQKAVYTALVADTLLMTKVTGVYDEADENAALPVVVIGDSTVLENSTKTEVGQNMTLTLHTWSEAGGRIEVKEIMGLVFDVLDGVSLALAGHQMVLMHYEGGEDFREIEGKRKLYHGVMRFRIITGKS